MKKYLQRGLVLVLVLCLIMGMSGCTEKYHNGSKAVIAMDEDTTAKMQSAVNTANKILTEGTLDDMLKQLPEGVDTMDVTNGWNQWEEIRAKYGELKGTEILEVFYYCYAGAAIVNYEFEDVTMTADMFFTSNYQLVYMDFYKSAISDEAEYQLPEGLVEETVVIGEGTDFVLEGTLTYPEGGENLPAVVLVHGIGGNDRDQTALATKMFRDLANGLAQQGMAVLRYDKRGYSYPDSYTITNVETLTVEFQTIDDAVLAAEVLKSQACVDPEQVYMIGHDLGGYVAPRIDLEADFAGYAIIAAPSRAWAECAYDQTIRYGLDGIEEETIQYIEPMLKAEIESIREISELKEKDYTTVILNQYAYFWVDLMQYDYTQMVADAEKPVMIIQGDADYQTLAEVEYSGWETALTGKPNVTMKLYEGLNHMMMEPEGSFVNVSKQYMRPLHVAEEVITDLGQWVLTQAK